MGGHLSHAVTAQALRAVAAEADRARDLCDHLDELIWRLVPLCQGEGRGKAIEDAQVVDALSQRLSALARFCAAVGQGVEDGADEAVLRALDQMPLSDLKRSLSARIGPQGPAAATTVASGDLDLF